MSIRDLPRPIAVLLSVALPGDWRADIARDLEEAWTERRRERGAVRAAAWLLAQSLWFSLRFAPDRIREVGPDTRLTSTDLKLAFRSVVRAPLVTTLTLVSLTVGIFAAVSGWTWIVGSLFTPPPFDGGERIVMVQDYNHTANYGVDVRAEEFLRRKESLTTFEALAAYQQRNVVVGGDPEASAVRQAVLASWDLLHMARTEPLLGRLPTPDDVVPGAPDVVVLPHADWVTFTGADPDIVGQRLDVGGVARTVIGVMPEGFGFPYSDLLWIPFDERAADGTLRLVGKLREGVSLEAARAELAVVARPDPTQVSSTDAVEHLVTGLTRPMVNEREVFILILPIALLVLILTVMATNVANLMLARNARRSAELAVRGALGASRPRIVGQLVSEVLLLVVLATLLGVWASQYAIDVFVSRVNLPLFTDYSLRPATVVFAAGLAALVTLVAGVAPALKATGPSPGDMLRDGLRGSSGVRFGRLTGALIVVQVTICVGFLSAATLLGQSLLTFTFDRYGIPAEETLVAQIYFGFPYELNDPDAGIPPEEREARRVAFMLDATRKRQAIRDEVAELEGVRQVAFGSRFPGNESERAWVEVEGSSTAIQLAEAADAGRGYFELVDADVLVGRAFGDDEFSSGSGVVMVNEPFVRDRLDGTNPLGRRLRITPEGSPGDAERPWVTIVGVVPDLGLNPGNPDNAAAVYQPLPDINIVRMAVRGEGDPGVWTPRIVEIARRIDADIRVQWTRTLADQMNQPVAIFRGLGVAFLVLGALALVLSAASIHALTGAAVTRRTRELGIRQALGAGTWPIVQSVLARAGAQLAAGALLGGVLTVVLLRLATVMPWEVRQSNPAALALVVGVLIVAGLAALAQPLGRALSIRPADAMRVE